MIAEMLVDIINMIAFITYIINQIYWHKLELISAKLGVETGFLFTNSEHPLEWGMYQFSIKKESWLYV